MRSELPAFETGRPSQVPEPEKPFVPLDVQKVKPGKKGVEELSNSSLARGLDEKFGMQSTSDLPAGEALKNVANQMPVTDRTELYKTRVSDSYLASLKEVESILNLLVSNKNARLDDVAKIVRKFVRIFITDRNIILNISDIRPEADNYLFHHSLNVCLLSINVAASYGY